MKAVIYVFNIDEARALHFRKRCEALRARAGNRSALDMLNAALLDQNEPLVSVCAQLLQAEGAQYSLVDASDRIWNRDRLKIAYLLPHSGITGGMKMLLGQAEGLMKKGHDVALYSHSPKPTWMECRCPYFFVHPESDIHMVVPPCDIVIAGYWDLAEDAMRVKAPLKYHFAQGDFDVFEYEWLESGLQSAISQAYTLPVKILTVSEAMRGKIAGLFGRKSVLIPNAIDGGVFRPRAAEGAREGGPARILLVGSDAVGFKGHAVILAALFRLKQAGHSFRIVWITPARLTQDFQRFGFEVEEHAAPPQAEIAALYRSADVYVCGSFYEAFALPPLEAMACGTAVVTTDNGGVREYARDGVNCLMVEPGDAAGMAEKIAQLLDGPGLRRELAAAGREAAKPFTWQRSIRCLERELKTSASRLVQAVRKRE